MRSKPGVSVVVACSCQDIFVVWEILQYNRECLLLIYALSFDNYLYIGVVSVETLELRGEGGGGGVTRVRDPDTTGEIDVVREGDGVVA